MPTAWLSSSRRRQRPRLAASHSTAASATTTTASALAHDCCPSDNWGTVVSDSGEVSSGCAPAASCGPSIAELASGSTNGSFGASGAGVIDGIGAFGSTVGSHGSLGAVGALTPGCNGLIGGTSGRCPKRSPLVATDCGVGAGVGRIGAPDQACGRGRGAAGAGLAAAAVWVATAAVLAGAEVAGVPAWAAVIAGAFATVAAVTGVVAAAAAIGVPTAPAAVGVPASAATVGVLTAAAVIAGVPVWAMAGAGAVAVAVAGTKDGVAASDADALRINGWRGTTAFAVLSFDTLAARATAWMPTPPGILNSVGTCRVIITFADPVTAPRTQFSRAAWLGEVRQTEGKMDHLAGPRAVTDNRVSRATPSAERTVIAYAAKRIPPTDD